MPTYKNETSATIIYDNVTFPPGETVNTWVFVPREKGLTEVSPEPNVSVLCLAAGELTIAANAAKELYVPDCTKFMASMLCPSGRAVVKQNYNESPGVIIDASNGYQVESERTTIEKFVIRAGEEGALVRYTIERVR